MDVGSQCHTKVAVRIVQQAIKAIDQMEATKDSTSEKSPKMDDLTINYKYNARLSGTIPHPRQVVLCPVVLIALVILHIHNLGDICFWEDRRLHHRIGWVERAGR